MTAIQDFTINQLEDTTVIFTLTKLSNEELPYNATTNPYVPINLSGSFVEMEIRTTYDSGNVLLSSTSAAPDNRFVLTDPGGGIMKWIVDKADVPTVQKGDTLETVYDIYVTDTGGITTRMLMGNITISRAVTR